MRIIKILLTTLIGLLIILAVGAILTRELLLLTGLKRVQASLKLVRDIDRDQQYATECMTKGSLRDDEGRVHRTQLRFVGDQQYVIEVICNQFRMSPIEVEQVELPRWVTHQLGQSGLVWGSETAGLNLECLGRTGSVVIKDGYLSTSLHETEVEAGAGPTSECGSFGYQCCDLTYQQGVDHQLTTVQDCPKSCYQTCSDRPLILSFTTLPYYNKFDRTLEISAGTEVTFSFTVSPNQQDYFSGMYPEEMDWIERTVYTVGSVFDRSNTQQQAGSVVLDFGDGEQATTDKLKDKLTHTYQCSRARCEYQALLTVTNSAGINSLQDKPARITVVVTRS